MPCTPAMASGLTDHQWSMFELLSYKVAPPALLIPQRRGRPSTKSLLDASKPNPNLRRPASVFVRGPCARPPDKGVLPSGSKINYSTHLLFRRE
jgi:hypothetical protein